MKQAKQVKIMGGVVVIAAMMLFPGSHALLVDSPLEEGATDTAGFTFEKSTGTPTAYACRAIPLSELDGARPSLSAGLFEEGPIADSADDEITPVVAKCSGENLFGAFATQPEILTSYITFAVSTDGGDSWQPHPIDPYEGGRETNPALAYRGSGNMAVAGWATGSSVSAAGHWLVQWNDITNWENIDAGIYDWSDSYAFSDWHNFTAAGYYADSYPEFWGMMAFIGNDDREDSQAYQCPWILTDGTKWYGEGYSVVGAERDWENCRTPDVSVDQTAGRGYMVVDFYSDDTGTYVLGVQDVPMETTWDDDAEWHSYTISGGYLAGYAHPDISVKGGSGYIACETNENGNQDIICFHTTDGFETTEETVVVDSADDETNPKIVSYGDIAQCIFLKNGNLFQTFTQDAGATWSEPEQINDEDGTVEAGWKAHDLARGGNAVWTDTRNGNPDIYFENIGVPAPVLNIETVSGGFGVSATITNTGGADAEDVEWTMTFDGPVFVGADKSGTVTVPEGGEATIKSGFILGVGSATATVSVGGASKTASGFVLGPFVLGLS